MQEIQAAGKECCTVRPRQFARVRKHAIEIDRHRCQSLRLDVFLQMTFDRAALISRNGAATHEQFEGVWHFKSMKRGEWDLAGGANGRAGCTREMPGHVHRDQHARVDVGRHRCVAKDGALPVAAFVADHLRTARGDQAIAKHASRTRVKIRPVGRRWGLIGRVRVLRLADCGVSPRRFPRARRASLRV